MWIRNRTIDTDPGSIFGSIIVFMDKVLELVDNDIPIVLITPMGFRLNQRKNSARWKKIKKDYPAITSILSLPIDTFDDTLFHTEVLFFNMAQFFPSLSNWE